MGKGLVTLILIVALTVSSASGKIDQTTAPTVQCPHVPNQSYLHLAMLCYVPRIFINFIESIDGQNTPKFNHFLESKISGQILDAEAKDFVSNNSMIYISCSFNIFLLFSVIILVIIIQRQHKIAVKQKNNDSLILTQHLKKMYDYNFLLMQFVVELSDSSNLTTIMQLQQALNEKRNDIYKSKLYGNTRV